MNFWIKQNKMIQSSRSLLSEIKQICTMKDHLLPNKNQNNILTNILVNPLANIFQHLPRWIFRIVKWDASSRWSFCPNSVWGCIETTTIGMRNPTLPRCMVVRIWQIFKDGSGVEDLFVWIAKTVSQKGDEADNDSYDPDDDRVELRQVEPEEIETKKYNCCKST